MRCVCVEKTSDAGVSGAPTAARVARRGDAGAVPPVRSRADRVPRGGRLGIGWRVVPCWWGADRVTEQVEGRDSRSRASVY